MHIDSDFSIESFSTYSLEEKLLFFDKFLNQLEEGRLSVAYQHHGEWFFHQWIKEAILLYFQYTSMKPIEGYPESFDKIPLQQTGPLIRRVPGSVVRRGSYIGAKCILMPSFVNIGAYVGEGTLLDTWSTVGSCAYIGKNCHISGGVGIGGVLEPMNQYPVIIEDDCFIGARCEIAEGVRIGHGSVLASGVCLTQSTRIYDREQDTISFGFVPPMSVVVPGTLQLTNRCSIAAAIIVKKCDAQTQRKTALNTILRDMNIDSI
jgi:2,3,4,5-tetrahydropyridine-2,6-dicarboxylate N-succinyltransferase